MNNIKPAWVIAILLVVLLAALFLNRPVKVSILENVYIEVGEGVAGPPAFYEKAIMLEDGRTIYISGDCEVREQ